MKRLTRPRAPRLEQRKDSDVRGYIEGGRIHLFHGFAELSLKDAVRAFIFLGKAIAFVEAQEQQKKGGKR